MAEDGHSTASAELDGRGPTTVSPLQSDSHAAVSQSPSECGESAPLLAARTRSPQPGPVVGYGGVAPAVPTSPSARRTAQGGFERHIGGSFVRNRSEPELRSAFSPVGASDPGDAVGAARSPVRSAVSAPVTPGSSRRRRLSSAKLLRASDLDGDPAHAAHGDELAAPLLHVVGFDEDLEAGSDSGSVNPDQAGGNDAARNGHASGRGRRQRRRRGSGPERLAWCERCFACNPDVGSEEEQTSGSTEPAPRKSRYGTAWTVCGVVTLFLIAGGLIVGVYMYDHLVVPPPIAWTPQTPSSFQKPCPYANKTYFSHTGIHPQAPVVVLNGSWATMLCWARHEGYPMYELQVDNWWGNESMVFSTAFMGNVTQHALSMLLPSVTYHARVRMWTADNKTASPFSPVTTFVTYDHGSCGNTPDMNRLRAAKPALSKDIQSCLVKCFFDPDQESCTTSCINTKVGVSIPCAKCWYDERKCRDVDCVWPCRDPTSAACTQCSDQKCYPACVRCTGIEKWAYPR